LFDCWYQILATMIAEVTLCYDPASIVFGGRVASMPAFIDHLNKALSNQLMLCKQLPHLTLATDTEFSAARGAALYASRHHLANTDNKNNV